MIRVDLEGIVEMGGLKSAPLTLRLLTASPTGLGGGAGKFDVPASFIGTVFAPGRSARLQLEDGTVLEMLVTGFDLARGRAAVSVPGPLPMGLRRRA